MNPSDLPLGCAWSAGGRCAFRVWAPRRRRIAVRIGRPEEGGARRSIELERVEGGYFVGEASDISPGSLYTLRLDDDFERPDPASRRQAEGVHGPSVVVDPAHDWRTSREWTAPNLADMVFYEAHIGAFTSEGTCDAAIDQLDRLTDLGATALSIMPVAAFPGERNWGYDGVLPWAVQSSYGGPAGLKRLVDACHERGVAVILDVVYNHLGPEGNYLRDFGPYFTDRYQTPWGEAINFDGAGSDEVRRYFIDSALRWIDEFRIDGLRLDAVHAIADATAYPFIEQLTDEIHARAAKLGRTALVIAESADNDARLLRRKPEGGVGMDAQWSDDFHHALHTTLTGESQGYYADYKGETDLAKAIREGFVYDGRYSVFRQRSHGRSSKGVPPQRFVVCAQNHDQVGNRAAGERLGSLVSFERVQIAAAATLLGPNPPMLFMGEEYGEPAPFLYFISHSDQDLVEAVRRGRREEFASFGWRQTPPDPQSEETFRRSVIDPSLAESSPHRELLALHTALLRLRRAHPALQRPDGARLTVDVNTTSRTLVLRRWSEAGDEAALILLLADRTDEASIALPGGRWRALLDSGEERFGGRERTMGASIESSGEISVSVARPGFAFLERTD